MFGVLRGKHGVLPVAWKGGQVLPMPRGCHGSLPSETSLSGSPQSLCHLFQVNFALTTFDPLRVGGSFGPESFRVRYGNQSIRAGSERLCWWYARHTPRRPFHWQPVALKLLSPAERCSHSGQMSSLRSLRIECAHSKCIGLPSSSSPKVQNHAHRKDQKEIHESTFMVFLWMSVFYFSLSFVFSRMSKYYYSNGGETSIFR